MWNYKDGEYIKLFRKLVNWEWYTDVNTKVLFIHCLIRANWKPGRWKGHDYERGQFFSSIESLSKETGLTNRQVRTSLKHLIMTGEVTRSEVGKNSLFTVVCFDKYQGKRHEYRQENDMETDMETDTNSDKEVTRKRQESDNRYKNIKNNKEIKEEIYSPSAEASAVISEEKSDVDPYGDPPDGWNDAWEKEFMANIKNNPNDTRKGWYDFWYDGKEKVE